MASSEVAINLTKIFLIILLKFSKDLVKLFSGFHRNINRIFEHNPIFFYKNTHQWRSRNKFMK